MSVQVIRVDFGENVGFGHLKRTELLADKDAVILCEKCDQKHSKFPVIKIKDKKEFFEKIKQLKPSSIILDHYDFDFNDEKAIKQLLPQTRLICIDDFEKEHFCDKIYSTNPCSRYEKIKIKPKKTRITKKGIMLSLGATDSQGLMPKILKYLKGDIHVYTTDKNPHLKQLKKMKIKLHINEDTKKAMQKHTFAILSASTLSVEALESKIDFIAIKTVKNQENLAKCLKKKRIPVISKKEIYKLKDFYDIWKRWRFRK